LRRRTVEGAGVEGGAEGGRDGGMPFPLEPPGEEEKEPVAVALPLRDERGGFPFEVVVVMVVVVVVEVVLLRARA